MIKTNQYLISGYYTLLKKMTMMMMMYVYCFLALFEIGSSVRLLNPIEKAGKKVIFKFKTDDSKLELKSMKNADGTIILEKQQLRKEQDNTFHLIIEKEKSIGGIYKLILNTDTTIHCKLTIPVEITDIFIMGHQYEYKKSPVIQMDPLSSDSGDEFEFSFKIINPITKENTIIAHQSMLQFQHIETKTSCKFSIMKKNTIKIDTSRQAKQFQYKSGLYQLTVFIADSIFQESVEWAIGTIDLSLPAAPLPMPSAIYTKALLYESDTTLTALPEIQHMMRPEDSRPNIMVSSFFTLLVIFPFFGFLMFLGRFDMINFKRLPSGLGALYGITFLGCLGSILVLFLLFWIQFTMFQTLGYLSCITLVTVLIGHKALRGSATLSQNKSLKME